MNNKIETKITFNDLINNTLESNKAITMEDNLDANQIITSSIKKEKSKVNITKKGKTKQKTQPLTQIEKPESDTLEKENPQTVHSFSDTSTNQKSQVNLNFLEIKNCDGLEYLKSIEPNTVDLILTDPPYIISRDSGMNTHYDKVKENEYNGIEYIKTESEWEQYKTDHPNITNDDTKENYMKYGTIYGKKYCVKTQYGSWDDEFTMDMLESFISEYYKKLKKGGTLIIWFDLWKITELKNLLEKYKFKQLRFIEWIKTNPQPLNSSTNYLTNCREIALVAVKDVKPVFNSKYDNGIYKYPLQGGVHRFHPTQKSLALFEDLIKKHTIENAIVLDTFLGGGTTAIACKNTQRNFKGCEISKEYYDKVQTILATMQK
jgi:site-specific DNA-methyltransferase (adenine-specific)